MISYRHHIVSLVAMFLALAVGVALGGGPLSDLGRDDKPASASTGQQQEAERAASYGDDFAAASAGALYADGLKGRAVAILRMPGADGHDVSDLGAQVEAAGGSVASTYEVQPALVKATEKSLVDTLGSQLMTQLDSNAVSANASTYARMGQILGLAVSADDVPDADVSSIRESLAGADLVSSPDQAASAPLVLVVLGRGADPAITSGLMSGLAAKATGVVVAGTSSLGAAGGALAELRSEPAADQVTTVDGVEAPLGQVTAVLALIRSLSVQGGSFGASGSDGAVPLK